MHSTLRSLFEQALKVSLASPLLLSCGGPGGVDTGKYELPVCEGGSPAVSGLNPASAVDYTELRRIFMNGAAMPSKLASSGTACGTASNMSACTQALAALAPASGFAHSCNQICSDLYLATTKGDTVGSVTTLDALKVFLGTIDSPQEALLLVYAQPFDITCGDKTRGAVRATADGFEVIATSGFACGEGTALLQHVLKVSPNGDVLETGSTVLEKGMPGCAIGRRPCGLQVAYVARSRDALARHFVSAAHLEAASVPAFLRLNHELAAHGAPIGLRLAAVLSANDEARHARAVAKLARRFGGRPVAPSVKALPLRGLFEVARDNAVEGCVRETYGALVAHRQAMRAKDAAVSTAMQPIAHDETRHAALSWQVHEWALGRLSRDERRELKDAQREAVTALKAESVAPVDAQLVEQAGMPDADESAELIDSLDRSLWS